MALRKKKGKEKGSNLLLTHYLKNNKNKTCPDHLQTPEGNLSRSMRHLNGIYTQRYNKKHGYDGQLFRGRYKSILVDADSSLLELLKYIHKNPLKAKLVEKIDDYPWSSHKGIKEQGEGNQI